MQLKAKGYFVLGLGLVFLESELAMSHIEDIRQLVASQSQGVLATVAQEPAGYPYTSIVPYCLTDQGLPLVLISKLAQHTRNVLVDRRVSLFVHQLSAEPLAAPRVTIMGDLVPVANEQIADLAARYYRFFPQSQDFHQIYDFSFWQLQPLHLHYIAGFARVYPLAGAELAEANPFFAEAENGIISHMNEDHSDVLPLYARLHGVSLTADQRVVMTGLDRHGFYLRAETQIIYIPFPKSVDNPAQVRAALVAMAQQARAETAA